jgi:cyclohexa-1,5-dienecarbonyl-CoA hydratase
MSGLTKTVIERKGAWVRIILDAPKGNLLSLDMVRGLAKATDEAGKQAGLRWLTFEGAGGHFSYGAKIQEHTPEAMKVVLPETLNLLRRILAFPAATAAIVDGRCLGGGFELALACDDIIATETATFGLPEIRLAAFPPAAAALLPARVGAARATRAIVTGQTQDATYWNGAGLLSMVAPHSNLIETAGQWFDTNLGPHSAVALAHAVRAARLTIRAQADPALDAAERLYLDELCTTADAAEGVRAWLEKRSPNWMDK